MLCYLKEKKSPLFVCTLDAEKCFDSIWQNGLFYKLLDILPGAQWRCLYLRYSQYYKWLQWSDGLAILACLFL